MENFKFVLRVIAYMAIVLAVTLVVVLEILRWVYR